ncbi:MAG TPA: transglutaminase-like domain-containing protein [Caldilineaceae bacterium]|nr:transglutaminase-like domain-containing protein [Caldilineaceae bacterium]
MDSASLFAEEASQPGATPERLALLIARLAFPDLPVDDYLDRLDELAEQVAPPVLAASGGEARAQALLTGVNEQLGFRGNHDHYYDAANSYLNVVLERRVGLPILLCVVCMALGRRLGLQVDGIGLPGHFMARYQDAAGSWLLDPFHGALLRPNEAGDYLARLFNRPVMLPENVFAPVTPIALAQRILNNLRNVYLGSDDYEMAARVVDYMLALTPNSVYLWQERGVVAYRNGDLEAATRALRRYFFLTGRLPLVFAEAPPLPEVHLGDADRQLLGLLRELDELRMRLN